MSADEGAVQLNAEAAHGASEPGEPLRQTGGDATPTRDGLLIPSEASSPSGACRRVRVGYQQSRPAERSAFWMSTSFAATIATSRTINYIRERRRAGPRTRGFARLLSRVLSSDATRVHHFLPGMGIACTAGGAALLATPGRHTPWLSTAFGVGVALTTDELRLLAGHNDPYWRSERFALTQAAAGTFGAALLAALFVHRGRRNYR